MSILYAEDDRGLREGLVTLLRSKGYVVTPVNDGRSLLRALEKNTSFTLVLTDNRMPNLSGLEALRRIRADVRHDTLPVIVLSGDADIQPEVERLRGAFYSKGGFDFERFLAFIKEASV